MFITKLRLDISTLSWYSLIQLYERKHTQVINNKEIKILQWSSIGNGGESGNSHWDKEAQQSPAHGDPDPLLKWDLALLHTPFIPPPHCSSHSVLGCTFQHRQTVNFPAAVGKLVVISIPRDKQLKINYTWLIFYNNVTKWLHKGSFTGFRFSNMVSFALVVGKFLNVSMLSMQT